MKHFIFFLVCFSVCSCANYQQMRFKGDVYGDFYEMTGDNAEGRDYSVEVYDRNSQVTVLAIHGGELENATSLVARNVAGKDFNLYLFNAWLGEDSRRLHVTSTHFNDSKALELVSGSSIAVSVHVHADKGKIVCVRGRNSALGNIISASLAAGGFKTENPCVRLPGTSEKNIVNKASGGGAQLEITLGLADELAENRHKLLKFGNIIKNAIGEYIKADQAQVQD